MAEQGLFLFSFLLFPGAVYPVSTYLRAGSFYGHSVLRKTICSLEERETVFFSPVFLFLGGIYHVSFFLVNWWDAGNHLNKILDFYSLLLPLPLISSEQGLASEWGSSSGVGFGRFFCSLVRFGIFFNLFRFWWVFFPNLQSSSTYFPNLWILPTCSPIFFYTVYFR